MNKLNKNNSKVEFIKMAKNIILKQEEKFTVDEILAKMFEKCSDDVEVDFLKMILFMALSHLTETGIIYSKNENLYMLDETFCKL